MGNSSNAGGGIGVLTLAFVVVAYFVYGKSLAAMLGMFLLVIGSGFTALLGLIPFIGVIIAYAVNTGYTYPVIMGFVGLAPTWLTNILLWFHTIVALVLTIATSIALIKR